MWRSGMYVCLAVLLIPFLASALHEDQVGRFDWHQKLIGPVRWVENDPVQPKRLLVGSSNNVVAALHSNTGALLYRQLLEKEGTLLFYGLYQDGKDRETIAVSLLPSGDSTEGSNNGVGIIKIRTFVGPTGVKKEEWAVSKKVEEISHVVVAGQTVYLVNTKALPAIKVQEIDLRGAGGGNDGVSEPKVNQRAVTLRGVEAPSSSCVTAGLYLACTSSDGAALVILNLSTNTQSTTPKELGSISELQSAGNGPLVALSYVVTGAEKSKVVAVSASPPAVKKLAEIPVKGLPVYLSQFSDRIFMVTLEEGQMSLSVSSIQIKDLSDEGITFHGTLTSPQPLASPLLTVSAYLPEGEPKPVVTVVGSDLLVAGGGGSQNSLSWTREESLTSVIAVEMVDYPSEVGPTWNPYLSSSSNPLAAFVTRVKYEIEAIITRESLYSSSEDRFGLRKVIVFLTRVGKVVGLDGPSGDVLYSFWLKDFELFGSDLPDDVSAKNKQAFLFIQRPAKYSPLPPLASVVYKKKGSNGLAVVYSFNPVEGKPLSSEGTGPMKIVGVDGSTRIVQITYASHVTPVEEASFVKPILLLDDKLRVHVVPSGPVEKSLDVSKIYFFVAECGAEGATLLKGYDVKRNRDGQTLKATLLWDLKLKGSLLSVGAKGSGERVHSQGRVLPDRSVSYKYMNPNLVAVATEETSEGNVNVYLIDAVSGSLVHSLWHKKAKGPVHIVHSEHWLVYSLVSEKNRRVEVNSVELYEGTVQSNSSAFSSLAAPPLVPSPIVVKQSYIWPLSAIQFMAHTTSEKGITNKDILFGLPGGGVLELPRIVLQPRLKSPQAYTQQRQEVHTDEDGVVHSIPYVPELPIPSEMIVNYNASVKRVGGIRTWPTRLESTCLLLVHGSDLFYTKLTPSKTFDVLKDDFDHWFILVVLGGLIAAAGVTKRLAARKTLDQQWK